MFRFCVLFLLLIAGCSNIVIPDTFRYEEIDAGMFKLASWQKISNKNGAIKIYIEGDGASFDAYGLPTKDPTPKGEIFRELAFGDYSPNVIYLARPCQFIMSDMCSVRHWTTARYSYEVIDATYKAIKQIAGKRDIILVGFSGGAQVAGLVAVLKKDLNVKNIVTMAGNLDHLEWTQYHRLQGLNESLNLADYKDEYLRISQEHYVGSNDGVIPPSLTYSFFENKKINIEVVKGASHSKGWEAIYDNIWRIQ